MAEESKTEQKVESREEKKYDMIKRFTYITKILESTLYTQSKPLLPITIPEELLTLLIDDWHTVNFEDALKELPRSPNIEEILQDVDKVLRVNRDDFANALEVIASVPEYVKCALPNFLLYTRQEREQYGRLKPEYQSTPQRIYGIEHLLRLFIMLPKLISADWFTSNDYLILVTACSDILRYFLRNPKDNLQQTERVPEVDGQQTREHCKAKAQVTFSVSTLAGS
eukprot:TRINITY_DN1135_c0_g2_i16.p1 TRINITY_DN1135_c0_g2~~TRINITY_DN1135_c0_g2_i16.p1  ORF type:complete len:226 (-),score=57.83 TRINITY_DN1135_c0_g2_i16:51-728(-)